MADVLIYWRDYAANWAYQFAGERAFFWHSGAKCIAELQGLLNQRDKIDEAMAEERLF